MEITRRGFLQAIVGSLVLGATSGLIHPKDDFSLVSLIDDSRVLRLHQVRMLLIYDLSLDQEVVRYDVYDKIGGSAFSVSIGVDNNIITNTRTYTEIIHTPVTEALKNKLIEHRINPRNIVAPPIPTWYSHSDKMMEILKSLRRK